MGAGSVGTRFFITEALLIGARGDHVRLTPTLLAQLYPRLYHMAEYGSWSSIKKYGLLSTSALLDLFEIDGKERETIEKCHRPECVTISHPLHGTAVVRDQKPMTVNALQKCLNGMTPQEWFETLNGKVFFWLSPDRLNGLLNARAYKKKRHCVITVDTAALLARHGDRVTLSPINSGATLYTVRRVVSNSWRRMLCDLSTK